MEHLRRRPSASEVGLATLSLLVGATIGVGLGWWTNRPVQPWVSFAEFEASYVLESKVVKLAGLYRVFRVCYTDLIWRTEILATDGQIALYGPKDDEPVLTSGWHEYHEEVRLLRPILEDGWVARVIITCPEEHPDTVVSPPAVVEVHRAPAALTTPPRERGE